MKKHRPVQPRWRKLTPLLALGGLMLAQQVMAHGYVSTPPSRSYLCKLGKNVNCGSVQWEPQSVEGPDGNPRFPKGGPADGTIAAAGSPTWAPLNEQTADRWARTDVTAGQDQVFTWTPTAAHSTKDVRYFITKNGWNPNEKLSRASFENEPFCEYPLHGAKLDTKPSTTCRIPADHSGYHVILGVWDVADTAASFYNAIDVNVVKGSDTPTPTPVPAWTSVGTIYPSEDLAIGDRVYTRVFSSEKEMPNLSASITLSKAEDGTRNRWPLLLAQQINRQFGAKYQAGNEQDGAIQPTTGKNSVFTKAGSGIARVEIAVEHKKDSGTTEQTMHVTHKHEYAIAGGKATVDPFVTLSTKGPVTVRVYPKEGSAVGTATKEIERSGTVAATISPATAGDYTLVVTTPTANSAEIQQSYPIKLTGGDSGGKTCRQEWSASTAYTGGAKVQWKNKFYTARWWTQDNEPGNPAYTGPDYSGKVWKDEGAANCN